MYWQVTLLGHSESGPQPRWLPEKWTPAPRQQAVPPDANPLDTRTLSPDLGLVLQDGGMPVDGLAHAIDPDHWDDIAVHFKGTTTRTRSPREKLAALCQMRATIFSPGRAPATKTTQPSTRARPSNRSVT